MMTRNEAIKWLKAERKIRAIITECQITEALDMAIEALSEPSKVDFRTDKSANIGTEVNDLISREDAIKALEKLREEPEQYYTQYNVGVDCSIKALSALPTADRPTGKWIEKPNHKFENYSFTAYQCSECGQIVAYGGYNYCDNCGAKMDHER